MIPPEGYTVFEYLKAPDLEKPLELIDFNGNKMWGVYTWDEERKTGVFFVEDFFIDVDEIEYWKYK